MAFLTDPELEGLVTSALQRAGLVDDSHISDLVPEANLFAQNAIKARFRGDGLTDADAADWFRAREFNVCLGIWWTLTMAGVTGAYDQTYLKELDRREELLSNALVIDEPDDESPAYAASGDLVNDGDIFTMDMDVT